VTRNGPGTGKDFKYAKEKKKDGKYYKVAARQKNQETAHRSRIFEIGRERRVHNKNATPKGVREAKTPKCFLRGSRKTEGKASEDKKLGEGTGEMPFLLSYILRTRETCKGSRCTESLSNLKTSERGTTPPK